MSGSDEAEKKASDAAKKLEMQLNLHQRLIKLSSGDSMEVASDGTTKVEKDKAVNQEEVESDEDEAVQEEMGGDMTKAEML